MIVSRNLFLEVGKKNDEEQAYFDEFYEEVSINIVYKNFIIF